MQLASKPFGKASVKVGPSGFMTPSGIPPHDGPRAVFITTFIIQISNGADTVVTFAALFADSTAPTDLLIVFTLATMAVIFVLVAIYGVRHPALSQWIERNAHRVTPWILLIVGAYIVANTATDLMPAQ